MHSAKCCMTAAAATTADSHSGWGFVLDVTAQVGVSHMGPDLHGRRGLPWFMPGSANWISDAVGAASSSECSR